MQHNFYITLVYNVSSYSISSLFGSSLYLHYNKGDKKRGKEMIAPNNWVNLIVSLHLIIRNICLFLIIAASVLCQCMYDNQSV